MVINVNNYIHSQSPNDPLAPIDTVRMAISGVYLTNPESFINELGEVLTITNSLQRCTRNHHQKRSEKYHFRYFPSSLKYKPAKLYIRHYPNHDCYELIIELSLPKLFFGDGNNIHELTLSMFDGVVRRMHSLLMDCGIVVSQQHIALSSRMLRIDIGKNFLLQHSTVRDFIRILTKLNKGYSYKPQGKSYPKGGLCVKWPGNQYTIFYDKVAEQQDINPRPTTRFAEFENHILRFEHRLERKQTIRRAYGIEFDRHISLKEAFDSKICQLVLSKNLDKLTGHSKFKAMLVDNSSMAAIYKHLVKAKNHSPYTQVPHYLIPLVGLLQELGEVETRKLICKNVKDQAYQKHLINWHSFAQHVTIKDPLFKDYEAILVQLDEFRPFQGWNTRK